MIFRKVKSGSLQFVIFVSTIIILIVSSFILLSFYERNYALSNVYFKETQVKNIENIQRFCHQQINSLDFKSIGVDGESTLESKQYGIFKLLKSTTQIGKQKAVNYALLGGLPLHQSIELSNHQIGLTISGKTNIYGDVLVPKEGVKPGFVNGVYFSGNQLIKNGAIRKSSKELSKISNEKEIINFMNKSFFGETDMVNDFEEQMIHNSFQNKPKLMYSPSNINLKGVSLSGNIIIKSKQEIHLYDTAQLKDVILIAPRVFVHEKVKGAFQVFSTDKIHIDNNVYLEYPSALVLQNTEEKKKRFIKIEKNTKIKGSLVYLSTKKNDPQQANILIGKNVNILGEIYCQGTTDISHSMVIGSVKTDYFIHKTRASSYLNTLLDVTISNKREYLNYSGLTHENDLQVAKWLY